MTLLRLILLIIFRHHANVKPAFNYCKLTASLELNLVYETVTPQQRFIAHNQTHAIAKPVIQLYRLLELYINVMPTVIHKHLRTTHLQTHVIVNQGFHICNHMVCFLNA